MKSHELQTQKTQDAIRPGRGISAGRGKTAGRGTKGQSARSGGKRRPGFEGGQTPINMRLPKKRGFRSLRTPDTEVYTSQLEKVGAKVTHEALFKAGLIEDSSVSVKLVAKGEVSSKHTVELNGASKGAIALVEKAGGTFTATDSPKKQPKEKSETSK